MCGSPRGKNHNKETHHLYFITIKCLFVALFVLSCVNIPATCLLTGDLIYMGRENMFRFNNPLEAARLREQFKVRVVYIVPMAFP